jgi:hypothetical protein
MEIVKEILLDRGITEADVEALKHLYLVIIMLPVVATIISIARHIIGIKSLSLYAPIILTFAFYELGYRNNKTNILEGLKYGVIIYLIAFITSIVTYKVLKTLRMHYLPKISLVLLAVSMATIGIILTAVFFNDTNLLRLNTFSLVMIITASEGFISVYARKNFKYALFLGVSTFVVATLSFSIISWDKLQSLLINYPPVILVLVIVNAYVGRFTGLRISEYWRFRKLLLSNDLAEKEKTK